MGADSQTQRSERTEMRGRMGKRSGWWAGDIFVRPFVRPRSGGASWFYRGPAAAVNSGDCAVPVRGDGSPILPGGEPRKIQRTREARELETEYLTARC